jgi:hypothetical protein
VAVGGVERGLDVEQQHRLQPAPRAEHAPGIEPARKRQCAGELRADAIGGVAEVADARAGLFTEPVREREQRRSARMLGSGVAEQNLALARQQAVGDRLRRRRFTRRRAPARLRLRNRGADVGHARGQPRQARR